MTADQQMAELQQQNFALRLASEAWKQTAKRLKEQLAGKNLVSDVRGLSDRPSLHATSSNSTPAQVGSGKDAAPAGEDQGHEMTTDQMPPLPYEAFDHSKLTGEQWVALWHAYARAHAEQQTKRVDAAENLLRVCFEQKVAAEQQTAELRARLAEAEKLIRWSQDGYCTSEPGDADLDERIHAFLKHADPR